MASWHSPDMRTAAQRAGDDAEARVAAYLVGLGWQVLGTHVRVGRAELDLVAADPGPPAALVVVEVRWRARRDFGLPEETVDGRKRARLHRAGFALRERRPACLTARRCRVLPVRFDLVVVEPGDRIRHYRHGGMTPERRPRDLVLDSPGRGTGSWQSTPGARRRVDHRSSHADRSDRGGAGRPKGRRLPTRVRGGYNRTRRSPDRAVHLDAAAARGRSPLRPPDTPLESQDEAVHLCRAQWDPHHRSRPDREAAGVRAGLRARDRRPG